MNIQKPEYLLFLLTIPLLLTAFFVRWSVLKNALATGRSRQEYDKLVRRIKPLFITRIFAMVLFIISATAYLANFCWGYEKLDLTYPPKTLVVVLDVSRSMYVEDMPGSRLSTSKYIAAELAQRVPFKNLSLVAYRKETKILIPPTRDREAFFSALETATWHSTTGNGNGLEQAVSGAIEILGSGAGDSTAILILTDGYMAERHANVVDALRHQSVSVHVACIGSTAGGRLPGAPNSEPLAQVSVNLPERLAKWSGGIFRIISSQAEADSAVQSLTEAMLGLALIQRPASSQWVWISIAIICIIVSMVSSVIPWSVR